MKLIDETLATTDWSRVWDNRVSLVANSGIQFLDFAFTIDANENFKRSFLEEKNDRGKLELKTISDQDASEQENDIAYAVKAERALQPFWGHWVPVPLFEQSNYQRAGVGPLDWCRARIVDVSNSYEFLEGQKPVQVQIAIDTSTANLPEFGDYIQPSSEHSEQANDFTFRDSFEDLSQFLRSGLDPEDEDFDNAWVSELLLDIFNCYIEQRDAKDRLLHKRVKKEAKMEGWSRYITLIQYLKYKIDLPTIYLLPSPENTHAEAIDVDLVLDIGNSRTSGLLVEQKPDEDITDFSRVSQLSLRNLSSPQHIYKGLFESRVEFVNLEFGNSKLARLSGRNNAFAWPSFVRFGPEAVKLVQEDTGVEAVYGTSSPKRYLWDNSITKKWPFRNSSAEDQPSSVAPHLAMLTPQGDYIPQIEKDMKNRLRERKRIERATNPTFSKSSLFGFMVAEILTQAFVQVNSATYRSNQTHLHTPRKLRRIILTLPTSTPSQEQAIVRSRVNGAISMIWDRMVQVGQVNASLKPEVILDWDEASCSHVVYLYNEVVRKFNGRNDVFFSSYGKKRKNGENKEVPSIRMGCVDVGGGTTDVMVTTFYQAHEVMLIPEENFREGFRTAGDDVQKEIIEKILLPKIVDTVDPCFKEEIFSTLSKLFGPNREGQTALERQKKRQYGLRVLSSLAEKVLESTSDEKQKKVIKVSEIEISTSKFDKELLDYLDDPVRQIVGPEWSLMSQKFEIKYQEIVAVFRHLFYDSFLDIADTMRQLGVDKVLLTGRTSMHPAVLNIFTEVCPCPAQDIIAMHTYKATWYPFADTKGRISDPKSTVVVGAMLIALSDSHFSRFVIPDQSFAMKSTANYIGRMEQDGQILAQNIIFKEAENTSYQADQPVKMAAKIYIGGRQFETERWVTSPLYKLDFVGTPRHKRPYSVKIEKREPFDDDGDANTDTRLVAEAVKEQLEIEEVEDAEGNLISPKEVSLQLRTLRSDEYWLDTGEFATDEL